MKNPFMNYVSDFEKEAEDFLRKYECEDAIETPQPIPIRDIATRLMSLDIVDTEYLSYDDSVQGAIAFTGGIIEVFDWAAQENIGYKIDHPAIFVDADIINPGRINNTLAHECYHWWRHRNYFNYRRTHENGAEFAFRCNRTLIKYDQPDGSLSDIGRMEWQAKTIAPKILMPRKATKKKIDALYRNLLPVKEDRLSVTASVIDSLADFFEVSKQSAAIRMTELGYDEAAAFCDPEYDGIQSRERHNKFTAAKQHQQPISALKAFELYQENDFLRSILDTGAFRFIEGYFVYNDEKYIADGNAITEYAWTHLAECTLDFSVKLIADSFAHGASNLMYRSDSIFKEEESFDANTQNTELFNKAKDFEKRYKRAAENRITAAEWMRKRMSEEHWYEYTFIEKTRLGKMDYSRVQGGTHNFTMRPLIAMGKGLGLDLIEMQNVLKLNGISFIDGDREHEAYKYLFTAYYDQDIDACNEFLDTVGVKRLGTIEKDFFNSQLRERQKQGGR